MRRREFLTTLPCAAAAQTAPPATSLNAFSEIVFLDILRGHVASLAKTSESYAVVEYPGATITKNFLAKSGLSATGVTRMLPAIAAWIEAKRQPERVVDRGQKIRPSRCGGIGAGERDESSA